MTRVYSDPRDEAMPVFILHQGNWMGTIDILGEWIKVLSIHGEGWVKLEDVESRSPGDLHIVLSGGSTVNYSVTGKL